MQRMNPPRGMGPMGPGPQVTVACPSVHLPGHPCAPAFSPLSKSVSLSTSQGWEEGLTRALAALSAHNRAGPRVGLRESLEPGKRGL